MKHNSLVALAGAVALCGLFSVPTQAQTVFFEGFESYASGSQMHGQGGWTGWNGDPSAGALVSSDFAFSGAQSVNITGASDLVHTFAGATSGRWALTAQQYIPTSSVTGLSYFIVMNTYPTAGDPADWSAQTAFEMASGWIIPSFGTSGSPVAFVRGQWAELRMVIDLDANTVAEYYNNQLYSSHGWQTGGASAIAAIDLYANAAAPVYYDNIRLTQIPEPSTYAMIAGVAALGVAVYARRKRA